MFNQELFPATNDFVNFGQISNTADSLRNVNSVDMEQNSNSQVSTSNISWNDSKSKPWAEQFSQEIFSGGYRNSQQNSHPAFKRSVQEDGDKPKGAKKKVKPKMFSFGW